MLACRGPAIVLIPDRVPEAGSPLIGMTVDDRALVLRGHAGKAPGTAETRPGAPLVAAPRHGTGMRVERPGRLPMLLSLHGSDAAIHLAVTPCLPRPDPRVDAPDAARAVRVRAQRRLGKAGTMPPRTGGGHRAVVRRRRTRFAIIGARRQEGP